MELLMEALHAKRQRVQEAVAKINAAYFVHLAALAGISFLLGRVVLMDSVYPCGPALTTALMARGRVNIYALPFIFLGALSNSRGGEGVVGDMIAAFMCGVIFLILSRRKLPVGAMAFIAAGVTASAKAAFLLTGPYIFMYDTLMLALEAVMVMGLTFLFYGFFSMIDRKGQAIALGSEKGIAVLTGVTLLIISGFGIRAIFFFSPIYAAALFLTLFIGYKAGAMEGGLTGIVSGVVLLLTASGTPAVIGIFACGGAAAGFFSGLSRIVAGTCFAAVCLSFGMMKGYPELYISAVDPAIAAALFMLLPERCIDKLELILAKVKGEGEYRGIASKQKIRGVLEGYLETFIKLAALYGKAASGSGSCLIPMQFKAMAKLTNRMIADLDNPMPEAVPKPKYSVEVGVSSYAKEDNISGDSYLCTEMKNGEYILALSDGMGKGKRAAEESALTLSSLHSLLKAGFDIELALRTINSLLMANSTDEIFSTVDMGIFNRVTGSLQLFKIGAAATFLKRGDHVEAVKISALPIGIVDSITVDSITVRMKKGDRIIIVSDGITEADRSDKQMEWILDTIAGIKSKDPQTMSDLIVNQAMERYGVKEKDDMTVITAAVN